ncbi:MAG: prolipoprotein diacylglyceryl transferase [Blautia sp.]|nr:prolipoprotein diacylglyceryl transferase [Blautia sp.]
MDMSIRFPHAGLELDYIGKAVHVLGMDISFYGILVAAGLVFAVALILLEVKRAKENPNVYLWTIILSLILGLAGSRALYAWCYWEQFQSNPLLLLNIRSGGLSLYGAVLGWLLAMIIVCIVSRSSLPRMADIMCLGFLIAVAIGRWGDFFNRSSFGEYTDFITAMQLPVSAVRASEVTTALRANILSYEGIAYIQAHPVFLYESIWCFFAWVFLVSRQRRKLFEGQIFCRCMILYGLGRIPIEWLRTDKMLLPGSWYPLNILISAGLVILFYLINLIKGGMTRKRMEHEKRRMLMRSENGQDSSPREEQEDMAWLYSLADGLPDEDEAGYRTVPVDEEPIYQRETDYKESALRAEQDYETQDAEDLPYRDASSPEVPDQGSFPADMMDEEEMARILKEMDAKEKAEDIPLPEENPPQEEEEDLPSRDPQ